MPRMFESYGLSDLGEAWKRLWSRPWRRVTFYDDQGRNPHRYLTPIDPYLRDFYGGMLVSATFEVNGVAVTIAQGTMTVSTNTADKPVFSRIRDDAVSLLGPLLMESTVSVPHVPYQV